MKELHKTKSKSLNITFMCESERNVEAESNFSNALAKIMLATESSEEESDRRAG